MQLLEGHHFNMYKENHKKLLSPLYHYARSEIVQIDKSVHQQHSTQQIHTHFYSTTLSTIQIPLKWPAPNPPRTSMRRPLSCAIELQLGKLASLSLPYKAPSGCCKLPEFCLCLHLKDKSLPFWLSLLDRSVSRPPISCTTVYMSFTHGSYKLYWHLFTSKSNFFSHAMHVDDECMRCKCNFLIFSLHIFHDRYC